MDSTRAQHAIEYEVRHPQFDWMYEYDAVSGRLGDAMTIDEAIANIDDKIAELESARECIDADRKKVRDWERRFNVRGR